MDRAMIEEVAARVTRQVLAALGDGECSPGACDGKKKILCLGGGEPPGSVAGGDVVRCALADYESCRNILRYQAVVITELSLSQLADVALGRDGDSTAQAVLLALLNGIPVSMTEAALPHRALAGRGSTPLFQLLERYGRTLQVFGVKLLADRAAAPAAEAGPPRLEPPKGAVPVGAGRTGTDRLIAEADARRLVRSGGSVRLGPGVLVTPAAMDVFTEARVEVTREEG